MQEMSGYAYLSAPKFQQAGCGILTRVSISASFFFLSTFFLEGQKESGHRGFHL
jgi:hypothetical protein